MESGSGWLRAWPSPEPEWSCSAATSTRRPMRAISSGSRSALDAVEHLISWPRFPCRDWFCGFLAGLFDAEGSYSRTSALRIPNPDPEIIGWITSSLKLLGFAFTLESPDRPNRTVCVRLGGGLREAMRFFHTVDPAITRKRSIAGVALKSDLGLSCRCTTSPPVLAISSPTAW